MKEHPILFFIQQLTVHRKSLIIGILLSLTLASASIALLALSGWFISAAALSGLAAATAIAFNYFIPASLVRFLALIRILSRYADRVINHDYTFKILTQLRVWFFKKLIPLSPANLLAMRSGDLLNRLVNDIDTLDHLYLNCLSPFAITACMLMVSTILMMHFSNSIALAILVISMVGLLFMTTLSIQYAIHVGQKIQQTQTTLRIRIVDTLQGLVDLLLFETAENRLQWLDQSQKQLSAYQKKLSQLKGWIIAGMSFLSGFILFTILLIGIPLVNHHALSGAILAMIIFLNLALYEQFISLPLATLSFGKTKEAAHRLWQISTQQPAVFFPLQSQQAQHHDIALHRIGFHYPNRATIVLDNFSLTIPAKKKLGLSGPSGIGKTTILNLLARIYDPQCGNILIGNTNVKLFSENALRSTVSYVTQQVHIFNASVHDNITLFQPHIEEEVIWYWLEKMALADDIQKLPEGINAQMGEFGTHFSGGQIRRIAMARALLTNTPILLLDEPSTGLDEISTQRIFDNCAKEFAKKTVVIATHDPVLLERMDDQLNL